MFSELLELKPVTKRYWENRWPSPQIVWDGKDNEDLVLKSGVMARYTMLTTGFCSLIHINIFPAEIPGVPGALAKLKYWAAPIIGGGLAYTTVAYLAANIRGKTDCKNHFFAGLSVGLVLGKCSRSVVTGGVTGMIFGILGMIAKQAAIDGTGPVFELNKSTRFGGALSHNWDFTLTKDREPYWVRSQEEVAAKQAKGPVDRRYAI